MQPEAALLLLAASVGAGALNAVAGGGTFLTFPALLLTGIGPVRANATSTLALWPGSVASALGYREELAHERRVLKPLAAASLLGGLLGALLLILTPERTFARLVPFLMLAATLLFAFGGRATQRLRADPGHAPLSGRRIGVHVGVQFGISIYGGYFGGGMGFLMLAAFAVLGMEDLHAMNGLKALLAALINGIAVAAFVAAGLVEWLPAGLMVLGAVAGGYGGARLARRTPVRLVRALVIAVGAVLTAYFFATTPWG